LRKSHADTNGNAFSDANLHARRRRTDNNTLRLE
jgi:hypothetical protein